LLAGTVFLFMTSASELAPQEDQGVVLAQVIGPPNATLQQMESYTQQLYDLAKNVPEYAGSFEIMGFPSVNQAFSGFMLKPWSERSRSAEQLQQELQRQWSHIAGANVGAFQFPALPGAQGLPVQFVITTTEPVESLDRVANAVLAKAKASGMFWF